MRIHVTRLSDYQWLCSLGSDQHGLGGSLACAGKMLFVRSWCNVTALNFEKWHPRGPVCAPSWQKRVQSTFSIASGHGLATIGDELVACDTHGDRLLFFSSGGSFLRSVGSRGTAPGQFIDPIGVAVAHGRLYVAERRGKRVQVMSLKGESLQVLPTPNKGRPIGIAADPERVRLYVITEFDAGRSTGGLHIYAAA